MLGLGKELGLTDDELSELLTSGKQTTFANRAFRANNLPFLASFRPGWRQSVPFSQLFFDSIMPTDTVLTLKLPEGYTFADLKLRRCESDAIDLDMDLVKLICKINALDFDKVVQNPGPVVTSILTIWYKSHLAEGGQPDALMEALKSGR